MWCITQPQEPIPKTKDRLEEQNFNWEPFGNFRVRLCKSMYIHVYIYICIYGVVNPWKFDGLCQASSCCWHTLGAHTPCLAIRGDSPSCMYSYSIGKKSLTWPILKSCMEAHCIQYPTGTEWGSMQTRPPDLPGGNKVLFAVECGSCLMAVHYAALELPTRVVAKPMALSTLTRS